MKCMMKSTITWLLTLAMVIGCLSVPFFTVSANEFGDPGENGTPTAVHMTPVNKNASKEATSLLSYLQTFNDSNRFVTGTFDINNNNQVYDLLKEQFGIETGLYSTRYKVNVVDNTMDFYNVDDVNDKLVEHYENGNILLVHADRVVEEHLGQFGVEKGLADSVDNLIVHLDKTNPDADPEMMAMWMDYQDKLIAALKKLEDRGVKAYMYRPWVEYNDNRVFNGIDETGYAAMRRVWQQTSEYMCDSGLKGFLMTYSPISGTKLSYDRYPGNDYVDVLTVTFYSEHNSTTPGVGGALSTRQFRDYAWYIYTGKPIGLSETSCRTGTWQEAGSVGRQSWYNTLTSMITNWPKISFVNCWGDGSYSLVNETNHSRLEGNDDGYWYLKSPYSVTLDQLPDYRNANFQTPGVVQLYTSVSYGGNGTGLKGNWYGLEEKTYTEKELKALGLDPADIASFHINAGYGVRFYASADATGDSWGYITDTASTVGSELAGNIRSAEVFRLGDVAKNITDIYASSADEDSWKANDGLDSRWVGTTDEKGQGWLVLDLGKPCMINRWVVNHASSVGLLELYNTKTFQLQYSIDGKTWTTLDTVENNTLGVTDRSLAKAVKGQYFRLLITGANQFESGDQARTMTIVEFKLFGLATGEASQAGDMNALLGGVITPDVEVDEDYDDGFVVVDKDWEPEEDTDESGDEEEKDNKPTKKPVKNTRTEVYFPWWLWVIVAVGVLVVAGGVTVTIILVKKKKAAAQDA